MSAEEQPNKWLTEEQKPDLSSVGSSLICHPWSDADNAEKQQSDRSAAASAAESVAVSAVEPSS